MAAEDNEPKVEENEPKVDENEPKVEENEPKVTLESSSKGASLMASKSNDISRFLCSFLVIFIILAGTTTLIVWLVYRPHKPHFTVVGAAVYDLNTTSPPFISTTMQFTIVSRNPNKRVSIYYEHLSSYVSYRNQAITPPVTLPDLFHDKKSTVALSPILGGGGAVVPVSPEVVNGLVSDEAYGVVGLRLVLLGKLRWKLSGGFKSGKYGVIVKCDMLVGFKKGFLGQVPLLGSPECDVDI